MAYVETRDGFLYEKKLLYRAEYAYGVVTVFQKNCFGSHCKLFSSSRISHIVCIVFRLIHLRSIEVRFCLYEKF